MQSRYGMEVSDQYIRKVWAAVTRQPRASVRELAEELGSSFSAVSASIRFLTDAGYIEHERGACRARRIVVPFGVI